MDYYHEANTLWPAEMPPLTREEAGRAARKLMRKFAKRKSNWNRRVWVSRKPPFGSLHRGWRRLVHDVSHRANLILYPIVSTHRHHNGQHAEIERDMVKFVIESGWLQGKLKPKDKAKPVPTPSDRIVRLQTRLARWQSKRKRAETAIRKLNRSLAYYAKKAS